MEDKSLMCVQCGRSFLFAVDQQERFKALGFDEPKRCVECRKKKEKTGLSRYEEKMKHKGRDNKDQWEHIYQIGGMRDALIVSSSKAQSLKSAQRRKQRGN